MSEKQHNVFFLSLLLLCIILILTLDPPARNNIPVLWGFLGVGLHGFWCWNCYMKLSKTLLVENKADLKKFKIQSFESKFIKAVDVIEVFRTFEKFENFSDELKSNMSYCKTYFRLSLIAFLTFALLGGMTVIMTWF